MPQRAPDKASGDDSAERLRIHNLVHEDARREFTEDVRRGLAATPKQLFPKYFYDELGSQLFEAICLLPEYYLTRAENEILLGRADEIVGAIGGSQLSLLELGSGSAVKTRRIIEAVIKCQANLRYIPVDISATALESSARLLLQAYPALSITAYASDYYGALSRIRRDLGDSGRLLALFLGSNIGNFNPSEAQKFLHALRRDVLREGDALLVGADLKKSPAVLEAAYDDALGVTAAFNLNLLARINRELDADFRVRDFKHVAEYNERAGRVEIYLESRRAQSVYLRRLEMRVSFAAGERIHTENSYKYDVQDLSQLARQTGFTRARTWLDQAEQFSSNIFIAVGQDDRE